MSAPVENVPHASLGQPGRYAPKFLGVLAVLGWCALAIPKEVANDIMNTNLSVRRDFSLIKSRVLPVLCGLIRYFLVTGVRVAVLARSGFVEKHKSFPLFPSIYYVESQTN